MTNYTKYSLRILLKQGGIIVCMSIEQYCKAEDFSRMIFMMWMWKFWRERIIEIEIAMLCKLCTKVLVFYFNVMWRSSLCRVFVQRQDVCGSLGIKQRPTEINKKPKPQQICHEIQIHQPCCKQSRVSFKLKSELRADRQYNNEQWMSASVLIFNCPRNI